MADIFRDRSSGLDSPARYAAAVTPHDSTDLTTSARALHVGTEGNISILTVGGDTVTLIGVSGFVPVCVQRVNATSTTASNIVALW